MRNLLRTSSIAAALLVAIGTAPIAAQTVGSGVPDNAVAPFGRDAFFPDAAQTVAQSFATSATAPLLQSFTVYLSDFFGGADLLLQASVFEFAIDRIVGPSLFTSAVRSGSGNIAGYDALDFTGVNLLLNPGTIYALLLRTAAASPDGSTNFVGTTSANTFGSGQLFTAVGVTNAELATAGAFTASDANTFGADMAIQMTFAAAPTSAVPEPATLVLVSTGVASLAGFARRRAARRPTTPV